jgi:hypothetical protein
MAAVTGPGERTAPIDSPNAKKKILSGLVVVIERSTPSDGRSILYRSWLGMLRVSGFDEA